MQREEVKAALRAWGHATANRFALSGADRSTNVLASNLRNLPVQSKSNDDRELVKRDGRSRRLRMAGQIKAGMRMIPLWACDPVPARNDADRPHDNPEVAVDLGIPDDLRWIDAAVIRIERQNPLRGLILRTEYTEAGSQEIKAARVHEEQKRRGFGGKFTKDMYRRELDKAIEVICWEGARAA